MARQTKKQLESKNLSLRVKLKSLDDRYKNLATGCYWRLDNVTKTLTSVDADLQDTKFKLPISQRGQLLLIERAFYEVVNTSETFKEICQSEAGSIIQ